MHIDVIAIGKAKQSSFQDIVDMYAKRMAWQITWHEIQSKPTTTQAQENNFILEALAKYSDGNTPIIALDERGKNISSKDFSDSIARFMNDGASRIIFIIGGADGLNDEVRNKASMLLSFGRMTWPHMMVRALLSEQLYRAQQIIAGHPYHRE